MPPSKRRKVARSDSENEDSNNTDLSSIQDRDDEGEEDSPAEDDDGNPLDLLAGTATRRTATGRTTRRAAAVAAQRAMSSAGSGTASESSRENSPESQPSPPRTAKSPAATQIQPAKEPQQADENLKDPVAASGVDLEAEETNLRAVQTRPTRPQASTSANGVWAYINKEELQRKVTRIASEGSMRALKADTLDLIAGATSHRLKLIIKDILVARNHRLTGHQQRPPAIYPAEAEHAGQTDPMWDQVAHDDVGKILVVLERVERDAERLARRERAARDALEADEEERRNLADQAAADADGDADAQAANKKRKQKPSVMREAKNIDAVTQSKLTSATARQAMFGNSKRYSWLQGGASAPASGASTPTGQRSQKNSPNKNRSSRSNDVEMLGATLGLSNGGAAEQVNLESEPTILWRDAVFALENERGTGAGFGSGSQALLKAQLKRSK